MDTYDRHRFGLAGQTSYTSANALKRSMTSYNQYLNRRRLNNRKRTTTSLPQTTPLRGDQPPINEDHDSQDEIEVQISPLDGAKNHPVTVQPIYFTNERDTIQRRILNKRILK